MPEGSENKKSTDTATNASGAVHGRSETAKAFISYASADRAIANAICAALEREGVKCWIAPRDVTPGEFYAANIVHAIDMTRVVVLVLSQHAANSEHVLREVERASSKRHRVLAFRIDQAPLPDSLEYFLNTSQWLDASATGVDRALPRLVDAVMSVLSNSSDPVASSPAPPPNSDSFVDVFHRMRTRLKTHKAIQWTLAIIIAIALSLGGASLWRDSTEHEQADKSAAVAPVEAEASSAPADARPSIAVLPFENRSRLEDDASFVDGMHDDILTQLSKVSALRVISRTSVQRFRDSNLSIGEIAKQLGVQSILEGGVQRAGRSVRVHVQLIDAGSDAHLWAESYDRELTAANIFAIQSEIAGSIATALKTTLRVAERARLETIPTRSLEAWQEYQLGKQRMARRTSAALSEAEVHFQKAIVLDSKFALAWTGLADTLTMQIVYAGAPKDAGLGEAEKAAAKALELDPNLAEGWASAGLIAGERQQVERGETMLRRAIAINPNYAPAHQWLSGILTTTGRRDEALASVERAVALDPLSAAINNSLGYARAMAGRFDEALVAFRQAIEIDPANPTPYWSIADVHAFGFGRFDTAMVWYENAATRDPGNPTLLAALAYAHWLLGDDAEAGRWLVKLLATGEGTSFTNAVATLLYLERDDGTSARRHAHRAAELGPWNMVLIRDDDLRKGDYATARARYAKAFPRLFAKELPAFTDSDLVAIDLALVLQHTGESERAKALLNRSEEYLRTMPRMGTSGYGIADVVIHALRGDTSAALQKLREAEQAGWRTSWRYLRDFDPNLASIRNEPEFKAVFGDIERDMAQQRARLATRPKDAPLDASAANR